MLPRWPGILFLLFLFLLLADSLSAQERPPLQEYMRSELLPEMLEEITPGVPIEIPARPESMVYDDALLFDPTVEERLSAMLKQASEAGQLELYVATVTFVSGESLQNLSKRFRDEWVHTSRGIVIVYQRGVQQMTMCCHEEIYEHIPKAELQRMYDNAFRIAGLHDEPGDRVFAAVKDILMKFTALIEAVVVGQHFWNPHMVRILIGFFGLLTIAGVVFWKASVMNARTHSKARVTHRFPNVHVGQRFGAPFSGGVGAAMDFGAGPQQ